MCNTFYETKMKHLPCIRCHLCTISYFFCRYSVIIFIHVQKSFFIFFFSFFYSIIIIVLITFPYHLSLFSFEQNIMKAWSYLLFKSTFHESRRRLSFSCCVYLRLSIFFYVVCVFLCKNMLRGIIKIMIIGSNKQDKGDSRCVSLYVYVNFPNVCDDAIWGNGTE